MDMTAQNKARLEAYEQRTGTLMLVLALAFVIVYGEPILNPDNPSWAEALLAVLNIGLWLVFLADFLTRAWLSGRPGAYIVRHPLDIVLLALPMLRALRALRVLVAARYLVVHGQRFALGRTLGSALAAALLLALIAALAVLDAERGEPGATITTFPNALWWVAETISTVGYGDLYPVTAAGRYIAVAIMVVGVGIVGVVTASVAAWFVSLTNDDNDDQVAAELQALRAEIAALREAR